MFRLISITLLLLIISVSSSFAEEAEPTCNEKLTNEFLDNIASDPMHEYSEVKIDVRKVKDIRYDKKERAYLRHILVATYKTRDLIKNAKWESKVYVEEVDRNCWNALGLGFTPKKVK